jgi:hypothetical protein
MTALITTTLLLLPEHLAFNKDKNMASFAKLDENNIVENIIVVSDDDLQNLPFPESEPIGIEFLTGLFPNTIWKQSCKNNSFRFRGASIQGKFHPECGTHGGFSIPNDDDTYIWDESVCNWVPPVPYPTDGRNYEWISQTQRWVIINEAPPQTTIIG